jgi:hypothetical protein
MALRSTKGASEDPSTISYLRGYRHRRGEQNRPSLIDIEHSIALPIQEID